MADGIHTRIDELREAAATAEEIARRFPDTMLREQGYTSESITLDECDIVREVVSGERVLLRAGVKVGRTVVWMPSFCGGALLFTVLDRLMAVPVRRAALLDCMKGA